MSGGNTKPPVSLAPVVVQHPTLNIAAVVTKGKSTCNGIS